MKRLKNTKKSMNKKCWKKSKRNKKNSKEKSKKVDNDRIKIRRDIRKMKKIKVVWLDKAWTSLIKAQIGLAGMDSPLMGYDMTTDNTPSPSAPLMGYNSDSYDFNESSTGELGY